MDIKEDILQFFCGMMKFEIIMYLSRLAFLKTTPRKSVAVISISDPDQVVSNLEGWGDVLELKFCDLVSPACGLPIFTGRDALKTVEFLEQTSCQNLLVHCEAGVSRSGAVAYFAAEKSGVPRVYSMDTLEEVGSSKVINKRVMELLQHVYRRKYSA